MADINVCAKSPAPEFEIPADETYREHMLAKMGYQEIEISKTDDEGETITVMVVGRVVEG